MVHPVNTPRINNNDDEVRLRAVFVRPGDFVKAGQELAEIETDKANFVVEAERGGHVLGIQAEVGLVIQVGSVLLWLGDDAGEPLPAAAGRDAVSQSGSVAAAITAKAKSLLEEHGVDPAAVPVAGERMMASDVEKYLASRGGGPGEPPEAAPKTGDPALCAAAPGQIVPLSPGERAMLRTVQWHRDEAAAAYLEIEYDVEPWEEFSARYAEQNRLLSNPLLPVMMHQLAGIAAAHPRLNSTILGGKRLVYDQVNLGLTIQVDDTLYLAVIRDAARMVRAAFLKEVDKLHKRAMRQRLGPEELQGATVGFSSMARWQVRRHIPILPPYVSLMCAHARPSGNAGILGATYDHRVLSGADTQAILSGLAAPPTGWETP